MNIKSGKIEGFEHYSQFTILKEFNTNLEMWLVECKDQFSKGELVGLKRLARFSAKILGVCNAKIGTVLKAIHDEFNGNGISRSTFKRMVQKAIKLGILSVFETERKNGSQSSNLYVFNRFPSNELPKKEKVNRHNKTINLSETNKQITKRTDEPFKLDHTFVSDRVPSSFVHLLKYFFQKANIIEEFWHMTKVAAYKNNREKEPDQVLETAIHSFKQLISKMKSKKLRNPIAYYYGIIERKFQELYFQELFEMGF
jgi:hypothetical protein